MQLEVSQNDRKRWNESKHTKCAVVLILGIIKLNVSLKFLYMQQISYTVCIICVKKKTFEKFVYHL